MEKGVEAVRPQKNFSFSVWIERSSKGYARVPCFEGQMLLRCSHVWLFFLFLYDVNLSNSLFFWDLCFGRRTSWPPFITLSPLLKADCFLDDSLLFHWERSPLNGNRGNTHAISHIEKVYYLTYCVKVSRTVLLWYGVFGKMWIFIATVAIKLSF